MRERCGTSWRRPRRRALTLVEVLLGLALLGTVLVGILLGRADAAHQQRRSQLRLEACRLADGLLGGWHEGGAGPPRNGEGWLDDDQRLRWRTEELPDETVGRLGGHRVRLSVFEQADGLTSVEAFLSVEFVVGDPQPEEESIELDGPNDEAAPAQLDVP